MSIISKKFRSSWSRWGVHPLTVLSSALIVFAFPPWNFWPLIWFCLVPWLIVLRQSKSPRDSVTQGFWLSFLMSIGGFYWVAYVLREFGGVPWPLAILGLLLFSIFGQPQFFLFAPIWKYFSEKRQLKTPLGCALVFSLLYCGIDWIVPKLFLDTLGHSFYLARHLRQVADLGGPFLLTLLVYWVNEALYFSYVHWKSTRTLRSAVRQTPFIAAICLTIAAWTYGYFRYESIQKIIQASTQGFQAAAIQANIGDFEKVAAERGVRGAAIRIIETFIQLSDLALKGETPPDLIIWPETSYPSTFRHPHSSLEQQLEQQIEEYAQKIGIPLLFGGYDTAGGKEFNAFFYLSPTRDLKTYRKNVLLPFGEYIPAAESIQLIRDWFPQVGYFGRGPGPEVIPVESPKIGKLLTSPIICYEGLFTDYVVKAAQMGSQVILNITNDSWFGASAEPELHLALTTFRSIETRLPMLRSTNTGISTLITADGEITHPTAVGAQTILNVRVPLTESIPTLIKSWGNWFAPLTLFLGALGLGILFRRRRV